ncbi:MAG: 3-deoxy-D-manno-octulosonic acid transferase [Bacteroidales bacterium]|nr:3-deoxy-D-manno-octulosonic acid transferase [Bacteroidales bacterium]
MKFIYFLCVKVYFLAIRLASPFNKKAKFMVDGRRDWENQLRKKVQPNEKYVWFHAASLGEFEQGRPLIERYKSEGKKILLTFFSPSGYNVRKDYDKADIVCYLPFDGPRNAKKFIDIVNPEFAVFVKYEFWYYTICELAKRQIPTYLICGIFREGQIFFRPWGKFYRKALECFNWLFIQDKDSERLLASININKVSVCGDTRIDRVFQIAGQKYENEFLDKFSSSQKCLVCGSTWLPDEKIISEYVNSHPGIKAVIVPHEIHEEHLLAIEKLLKKPFVRLSKCEGVDAQSVDFVIVDSIGMLSKIYRYADVAYVGGGFGVGIHNTLEAVVYGIPVIFGPNYRKFKEAKDLIACSSGFSVSDYSEFSSSLERLLFDEVFYKKSCSEAEKYVQNSVGVSDFIYSKIGK